MSSSTGPGSSDSEIEPGRTYRIPDQNATPRTLRTSVVDTQKLLGLALKQKNALAAELAELKASKPGRRKKTEASPSEAPHDYDDVITNLGKSFTVLEFPWVDPTIFSTKVDFPIASPSDLWRPHPPCALFPRHLAAMLYQHIPEKFHSQVTTSRFSLSFSRHASNERSTALKTLKAELPLILLNQKVIADVNDPSAWRMLVLWPEDMDKNTTKISLYPPVIYRKKKTGFMKSRCARAILFGPASLQENGSRRPQGSTLGQMWGMVKPTPGLIAFICTTVVFVCYWSSLPEANKPKAFEPVGTASKISFRDIYMRFRWALESKAEEESTKEVLRFWHEHLFKGIIGVPALLPPRRTTSEYIDEEAELEDALGDVSLAGSSDGEGSANELINNPPARAVHIGPVVATANTTGAPRHARTAPQVRASITPPPSAHSDEEIDESVGSPLRPINRRARSHQLVVSDDNEGASSQPEDLDAGGRPADLRVGLEDRLKKLKVSDLKTILQDAGQPPRAKAVKSELIAGVIASDAAVRVYLAHTRVTVDAELKRATVLRPPKPNVDLVFMNCERGCFMLETETEWHLNVSSGAETLTANILHSTLPSPSSTDLPQKMSSNGHVPDGGGDSPSAIMPHITDLACPDPLEKLSTSDATSDGSSVGPTTPALSDIAAKSPAAAQVADDAEAHHEDDHHVTHMHTIALKQSLSRAIGGFLPQRLSRVLWVLPNSGGGTDTMLGVSVAATTVELAEDREVTPLTVVHAPGALHHRQSKSSIASMNKPGWATRTKNFIKFRRKSKILLMDGAAP
ncbi:hypothetical protein K438DRAFT_1968568 [Mycena galopus ATCC 62051]|nr:hypothetical protein K438DRAFT_1968568 [Mycena galopus ATCC 62051]